MTTLLRPSTAVRRIPGPVRRDVWLAAYLDDPEAVPYQSPDWMAALCTGGRYVDASRSYETGDGRSLVLPLIRRAGRPVRLSVAASLPMSLGMGGVLAAGGVRPDDVAGVCADLAASPYATVTVRPNPRRGALWSAAAPESAGRVARRAHVVELDGVANPRDLLSKSVRKTVEKAERRGLDVEWDLTGEQLPVLESLYARSVERWAQRQHEPLALSRWRMGHANRTPSLAAVVEHLRGVFRLGVVRVDGEPAAAGIVLIQPGMSGNGFRMAMDAELVGHTGAGYLVQVRAVEEAHRLGCRTFQLGESGEAGGLSDHKERMGGVAYPYEEILFERLPVRRVDEALRGAIKRVIGFRDLGESE
jgi:hypothetical protein